MELKRRSQQQQQPPIQPSRSNSFPESNTENGSKSTTKTKNTRAPTSTWVYVLLLLIAVITVVTIPHPFHPTHNEPPSYQHVFYYGWLTALSTGMGVLPFLFLPQVPSFWIGVSNAVAAGMMLAASYSLFLEGYSHDDPHDTSTWSGLVRTSAGAGLGLLFIVLTKNILDQYEDVKVGVLGGTDARKALLIFFVMTLHSFSEGVGIGVSFGGSHGSELGMFISASLAAHNVPEGLAIAVILLPRGVSTATALLWTISTSLPQPIMAVPAYMFVHEFVPVLPIGLGFAAGAMVWVAVAELLMEAIQDTNVGTTLMVAVPSCMGMLWLQAALDLETRSS